jgi:hypothetical protein
MDERGMDARQKQDEFLADGMVLLAKPLHHRRLGSQGQKFAGALNKGRKGNYMASAQFQLFCGHPTFQSSRRAVTRLR